MARSVNRLKALAVSKKKKAGYYPDGAGLYLQVSISDTALVLKVIEPLWATKTETASRVRNRIELVLDWARSREYRSGENPAR